MGRKKKSTRFWEKISNPTPSLSIYIYLRVLHLLCSNSSVCCARIVRVPYEELFRNVVVSPRYKTISLQHASSREQSREQSRDSTYASLCRCALVELYRDGSSFTLNRILLHRFRYCWEAYFWQLKTLLTLFTSFHPSLKVQRPYSLKSFGSTI